MASLNSWLSETVLHALGWALIHSLWQCLAVAALAALVMAFCRRPSIRYIIAVGALALMLAAPVATFFLLMRAPVPAASSAHASVFAVTAAPAALSVAIPPKGVRAPADFSVAVVREVSQAGFLPPSILPWLVAAWLCGVAFFSLRFAGGFLLLEHRCRSQSVAPRPRVLAMCRELQRQLGLDRAIRYLECGWLQTPAVIGWLRPVVLLPVTALIGLSEEQLRAVIAHELAHIRRHDWLVNLFQILVETLLFYHPAMWWLNRRIRAERELACDDIAVSLSGNRLDYARALTLMAEWEKAPALAMAANRGPLSERIFHILGRKPAGAGQRMLGLTGSVVFLAAALGAANALFGIAYPIPAAQAALSSSQVAVEHMARRVPAAKTAAPGTPDQNQAANGSQAEKPVPPASDLSPMGPLATPTVVASNVAPPVLPAPVQPLPAPAAPVPPNDPPAVSVASVSVQAPLIMPMIIPAATPAKAGPETVIACRNASIFGRVISSQAIQMQGFTCFADANSSAASAPGSHDIALGSCPLASTTSAHKPDCKWDVALNVHLADPADAGKMQIGKLVRLGGDFHLVRRDAGDYLFVDKAKILFRDNFWTARGAGADIGPFYSPPYGGGFNGGPDPSISPNASSPCGQCGVHF